MESITADDGEPIHYHDDGEGPPLVLLHGWTSTHRDWNLFVAPLAARHRLLRWDARAHGGHALRTGTVATVERMARDLDNLLTRLNLRGVTLVGHSMGALTLWQYLRDFGSERIAAAVVIDQSPKLVTDECWDKGIYGDFDWARNAVFMRALEHDFAEAVLCLGADGLDPRARQRYLDNAEGVQAFRERMRRLAAKPLIDCWASLSAADYRDVLPSIDVPVLLVYGARSNFYTAETAAYVRDAIADARLEVYADVDHSPHLWCSQRFVDDLLSFVWARRGASCPEAG